MAAARDGNACVLDISTDGVSCDVEKNFRMNLDYLEGKCNTVAMTDNKHNNKNARGQAVTGSSPSSLGSFVLDPWHLKQAGVAREIYAVQIGHQTLLSQDFVPLRQYLSCSVKISRMLETLPCLSSI